MKQNLIRRKIKILNNVSKMPSLGIGTFMLEPDVAEDTVCN